MPAAANPDAGVAVGAAEVFAELMSLHVSASGDDGGVPVEAHDHVADIDGVITKLAALAGRYRVLLGGDLAEGCDGDVVLGEGALRKLRIAMEAGFLGLALHVNNL